VDKCGKQLFERDTKLSHVKRKSLDREASIKLTNEERSKAYSHIITTALDFAPKLKESLANDLDIEIALDSMDKIDIDVLQDGTLRDALYIWISKNEDTNVKALVGVLSKTLEDTDLYGNTKAINVMSMLATMTFLKGALDSTLSMAGMALASCPDIKEAPSSLTALSKALVLASVDVDAVRRHAYDLEKSCLSLDTDEFWKLNF
jgi:hypothetical protein